MAYGYVGKILHVDLTSGALTIEEPPETFYRKYLGGSAMGMHYALKLIPPNADALGPENVLALSMSVTTGAAISGQVIASGEDGQLIHHVDSAGEAEQVYGEEKQANRER